MSNANGKHKLTGAVLSLGALATMALFGALFGGCSTGFGDYCANARLCEGGNDVDQHACELSWGEREQNADLHNCDTEYDAFADCFFGNSRCNNGKFQPDASACSEQELHYVKCVGGPVGN